MKHKNLLIYFNIFLLTLTIAFSNIYSNFAMAETNAETTTETTTEAPSVIHNFCESEKQLDIKARAAILVDADTGVVLYEKNADEVLYPASITKIMTALLGCEYGDEGRYDETITHSENAINGIGYGSSTMGMLIGEQISLEDCLYGIIMCSANEACMALAEHISGSVDGFVSMMNERAADLGCTNTHFANPHGFHDPDHYTTARDMSIITREAIKNEKFSEIWGTMLRTLPPTNLVNEPRGLVNKAKILDDESQYYYPYIKGAKTGFHDEALNTLVTYAEKDGAKLISVVMKDMGAPFAYSDAKLLFDYGFTQYSKASLYDGSGFSAEIPVVQTYNGREYSLGSITAAIEGNFETMVPTPINKDNITAESVLEEKLEAPVAIGDIVGTLKLSYEGTQMGEMDIVASTSIEKTADNEMAKKELMLNIKLYGKKILKYGCIVLGVIIVLIILIKILRAVFKSRRKKKRRLKKSAQSRKRISENKKRSTTAGKRVSENKNRMVNTQKRPIQKRPSQKRKRPQQETPVRKVKNRPNNTEE